MKKNELLLGAHISISGGVQNALYKGSSIGCTAIQIFTHSNRQWSFKIFGEEEIALFNQAKKTTSISHIITHASYLINLASNNQETREKSILALKSEIARCNQLGIKYLVLHPGSGNPDTAIEYIIDGLNEALSSDDVEILLEIMAGQGSSAGSSFESLAKIRDGVDKKHLIGICFDTCHAWSAGYEFNTSNSYISMWLDFEKHLNINLIKAFHLNDSMKNMGSKVDRHAHIGKGTIGLEAFRLILNDEKFFNVPKIIETPKEKDHELEDDRDNLTLLQSLVSEETKKIINFK